MNQRIPVGQILEVMIEREIFAHMPGVIAPAADGLHPPIEQNKTDNEQDVRHEDEVVIPAAHEERNRECGDEEQKTADGHEFGAAALSVDISDISIDAHGEVLSRPIQINRAKARSQEPATG